MFPIATRVAKFAQNELRFHNIYQKHREFTMIPERTYRANLRLALVAGRVDGCVVECGTWRGGMIAGIADVLGPDRRYFLYDSYEGLPPAGKDDGEGAVYWQNNTSSATYYDNCSASEEEARAAMSRSAARDYRIVKGWFEQTLPVAAPTEPIALLRMDADWYESTLSILDNLASRVVPGGMIIVDDYYVWEGCTKAVNEYAARNKWKIRESRYAEVCFIVV